MDNAALIAGFWKHLSDRFDHAQGFISDDEMRITEPALFQPYEEVLPAFKVFFQAFGSADDLTVSISGNSNGDKDRNVFVSFTSASFEEDTVHIDIRIFLCQRAVAPLFNVFICLFVEVADRAGGHSGSPESFGDIGTLSSFRTLIFRMSFLESMSSNLYHAAVCCS